MANGLSIELDGELAFVFGEDASGGRSGILFLSGKASGTKRIFVW